MLTSAWRTIWKSVQSVYLGDTCGCNGGRITDTDTDTDTQQTDRQTDIDSHTPTHPHARTCYTLSPVRALSVFTIVVVW